MRAVGVKQQAEPGLDEIVRRSAGVRRVRRHAARQTRLAVGRRGQEIGRNRSIAPHVAGVALLPVAAGIGTKELLLVDTLFYVLA